MKTTSNLILLMLVITLYASKTNAQSNPVPFYIKGTGYNHSTNRVLKINGTDIYNAGGRGLRLTILNKSNLSVMSDNRYDTYGSSAASNNLAAVLNGITNMQIGILTSYDAWEANVTTSLDAAFMTIGLTKAALTENSGSRRPYAAVFEKASNNEKSAKVIEVSYENSINQPFAEISGQFLEGSFIATGSQPNALFRPQGDKSEVVVDFKGYVGIGKLTPTAKLHVDGNIIAEEIKIENVTGADFVFAPNYNLMPLTETEAYIKANHHLPQVPSAAEMQANGIELGKMNMLLLQKIEELTLHQIEMSKLLTELQKQLKIQNQKITNRENKLK